MNPFQMFGKRLGCQLQHAPITRMKLGNVDSSQTKQSLMTLSSFCLKAFLSVKRNRFFDSIRISSCHRAHVRWHQVRSLSLRMHSVNFDKLPTSLPLQSKHLFCSICSYCDPLLSVLPSLRKLHMSHVQS